MGRGFQVRFWVLWRSEPARRRPTNTPYPWEQALARYTDRMPENWLPPPLAILSRFGARTLLNQGNKLTVAAAPHALEAASFDRIRQQATQNTIEGDSCG